MRIAQIAVFVCLIGAETACSAIPRIAPASSGATFTPAATATPTVAPDPTVTATPAPTVRVEAGERALFNGDHVTALSHFQSAGRDASDPALISAARWGEARALFAGRRYEETLTVLEALVRDSSDSQYLAQAHFLAGQAHVRLQQYHEAADEWQAYLFLRPNVLDAHVQELRGDALYLAQDYTGALAAYTAAIQAPKLNDSAPLDIKAADTRAQLQDYDVALAMYEDILGRSVNDYVKAQAAYEAGQVHEQRGDTEGAFEKYRLAVENYPLSYYSYLSLVELVDAGSPVDDLDRGLVDYHAGEYGGALAALDRYLVDNPINDGTPHYYRALTLRALGNADAAVSEYSVFIENYSPHARWVDAWAEKAETQWLDLGLNSDSAETLIGFVRALPDSPAAPGYLMTAARILEIDDQLLEAAQLWQRVADEYPVAEEAPTAIFLSGIIHYRLQDFEGALASFDRSLVIALNPEDQARAYLWIGKCRERLGESAAAQTAWQQGQSADPGGYYSERIRDLLSGRPPLSPHAGPLKRPDLLAERSDADAWMRLTFDLAPDTSLAGPGDLANDTRFVRGTELWGLGLYEEGRAEFEALRQEVITDPVASYRLANFLLDLGLYRTAILTAREVLTLAGLDDHTESMMAPPYFGHVRYGLYYEDLLVPAAEAEGLDPLLLYSIVRQESLFEGFVESVAGARGLMQIMPGTGVDIASRLGWPVPFEDQDLYRPDVSIRLGANYLASNQRALDGDMYAALAAYNGGPGNAVAWKQLAADDPDLFLEIVRAAETRLYIRRVYEYFTIYNRLYRSPD